MALGKKKLCLIVFEIKHGKYFYLMGLTRQFADFPGRSFAG